MIEALRDGCCSLKGIVKDHPLCYWGPLLLWMGVIFFLSSRPALPGPGGKGSLARDVFNYAAHAFSFGLLTVLAWRFLRYKRGQGVTRFAKHPGLSPLIFALLYALGDEFHQCFVPGRTCSLTDILADLLGIIIALLLAMGYARGIGAAGLSRD